MLKTYDNDDVEISYHLSQTKRFYESTPPYAYRAALNAKKNHDFIFSSSSFKIARSEFLQMMRLGNSKCN